MSEILTVKQVDYIRRHTLTLSTQRIEHLCDSHQALYQDFQNMITVREVEQMSMQEMEADLRALAEAIIEYRMAQNPHNMDFPEMQPVTNALYRPGVQRLIAKDVTAGSY